MKRTKEACGSCGYESYQLFSLDNLLDNHFLLPGYHFKRCMPPSNNLQVCRACSEALLLRMKSVMEDFITEAEISATWREDHD